MKIYQKIIAIPIIIFSCSISCYGADTNRVEKILEKVKDIRWETRNYLVKDINDLEKVAQTPDDTLRKKVGNCVDQSILIKDLAEKSGMKAELKFENNGKHVVVIVTEGVKRTKISGGRRRF